MSSPSAPELPEQDAAGTSKPPETDQPNPAATPEAGPAEAASADDQQEAIQDANEELRAMMGDDSGGDISLEEDGSPLSDELAEDIIRDNEVPADEPAPAEEPELPQSGTAAAGSEDGLPDDDHTRRAVEEIVAEEADMVLMAEDQEKAGLSGAEPSAKRASSPIQDALRKLWANPRSRWAILGGTAVIVLLVALIPGSRYFVLNTAGVRASLQLRVVDGGTMQPLRNVTVQAGGATAQTDSDGSAKLEGVRLGRTLLQIEKRAFAPTEQPVTIGWGSNPMGEYRVTAVGTQYVFFVRDFLSGRPIERAEATSGEGNASSDKEGRLVLTLDTAHLEDAAQISVDISADEYRKETVNLTVNNKETQSVDMVPGRKHVFVSRRSGNYDVYAVYADGRGEQKLVSGTGLERDDIALVPYPAGDTAALVSTRERVVNPNGYLLSTLYLLDTNDGSLVKIDQSEQIQIIGWSDKGRLLYVKIAAGASGTDPKRHRLMSFDSQDFSGVKELAASNSFNDVVMAGGRVYYAPSNMFAEAAEPGLFGVDPDGSNRERLLEHEVFMIVRSAYDVLDINADNEWYSYRLKAKGGAQPSTAPAVQSGRMYMDGPDNDFSLWVDNRDGRGVLLRHNTSADQDDETVTARSGLKLPVYWLNRDYAVFRVHDGRETADYVVNTAGGEVRKITDVTDSAGISRWFYY